MGTQQEINGKRFWTVKQGGSVATVTAVDYAAAVERARYIGFHKPESIVLRESVA